MFKRALNNLSIQNHTFFCGGKERPPPTLLNEVHGLIEAKKIKFALSGSSARKLKRGHANLLGGRALRYELYGLNSFELGKDFDLNRILNAGYLPDHYLNPELGRLRESYVADYLKEEIAAEALVKNLIPFSDFLSAAALSDTEKINFSTFAREVGVSGHTVKEYFQNKFAELTYWGLSTGKEVGLRTFHEDQPKFKNRYVVCLETRARTTDDGILILPYQEFARRLWPGKVF